MVVTRWGLSEPQFEASGLDVGTYHWRVYALDKFGLPGTRSEAWRFDLRVDATPPYLAILEPAEGAIVRTAPIRVSGESEPDARLAVDGREVQTDADGRFEITLDAGAGLNTVTIEARDAAGNVNRRSRQFVLMPDEEAPLAFDPEIPRRDPLHFLTSRETISLAGQTAADAKLEVRGLDGKVRAATHADADGRFGLNVTLVDDNETFDVAVVTPSGFTSEHAFGVSIDREPPTIALDEALPVVTATEWLPLRGRARGAVEFVLDGREVELLDESFDETLSLAPGPNRIEMAATDQVGNVQIERFEVMLDQEPPQLLRHRLSSRETTDGAPLTVEVEASDPSGLKKAARVTLAIGERTHADFLEFDPARGSYRGKLFLPPDASGRIRLKDIELEDYAGNRRRYAIE